MGEESQIITLRTKLEDIEIEVQAVGISALEKAYISPLDAKMELEKIQLRSKLLLGVKQAKARAIKYWEDTDEERKIIGVNNTPIAMMLSLLDSYPKCKNVTQVASEVGTAHSSISRYFSGEYGEHTSYFEKCNDDWKLSPEGVHYIDEWLKGKDSAK